LFFTFHIPFSVPYPHLLSDYSTSSPPHTVSMRMPPLPPHLTSKLPGGSSLLRIRCIISEWTQTQKSSTVYVLGASYQLVYVVCLVVQCLRDLGDTDKLRLLFLLQDRPSPQLLSAFPNSTSGVSCFSPLIGCKYLHLTLSTVCWVFQRAVMIDPFLWTLHSLGSWS
jgi:hypothetical protein